MATRAIAAAPRRPLALGRVAGAALVALVLFFLILPTLVIVPMSLGTASYIEFPPRGFTWRWYLDYVRDPDWMAATWFSLRIATASTVAATVIGTLASLALVRGRLPAGQAL